MSFRDVMSVTCFIDNQTGQEICLADLLTFMANQGGQQGRALFIQDEAPVDPPEKYLWIQTNIDGDPDCQTFWIESGE